MSNKDDEALGEEAKSAGNALDLNIENAQHIITEKMKETLQEMFETIFRDFMHDKNPLFENKLIFYCLIKTEGDVFIQLNNYDKAIGAYKAMRNYCRMWGLLE